MPVLIELIKDLCFTPNLQDATISFMDIDEERLEAAYRLCTRYSEEVSIKLNLEKTLYRWEALKGADFVINTALSGSSEGSGKAGEWQRKMVTGLGQSSHFSR